jgi:hypothetical protein
MDAAREAFQTVERLCERGEKRENAVMLSGMQLASALLRDSSFSLVARGLAHDNNYTVDLDQGTVLVQTRLFAVISRRTSFFKVEIAGKLNGGLFVVRNAVQNAVIMQVEEQQLRQPNFFSTSLAQECLRTQMEQERFGRIEETVSAQANQEIRIIVVSGGSKVPILLRQKGEGGSWDIVDGRKQELVGTLTPECEGLLNRVIEAVKEIFESK